MKVICTNFSRFHDKRTGIEFRPELRDGVYVGMAEVSEEKAAEFESREGFEIEGNAEVETGEEIGIQPFDLDDPGATRLEDLDEAVAQITDLDTLDAVAERDGRKGAIEIYEARRAELAE